jgi:hypothetical protein
MSTGQVMPETITRLSPEARNVTPDVPPDRARGPERIVLSALVTGFIALVAILSVSKGTYVDDEIFSIKNINASQSYADLVNWFSTHDIHPAGSYVVLKALSQFLGSWILVKIAVGCLNAVGLGLSYWHAYPKLTDTQRKLFAFVLGTSASVMLAGTSLRWYALFDPICFITLAYIVFSDAAIPTKIALCGISCVLLFYLSYSAMVVAAVFGIALFCSYYDQFTRRDIRVGVITALFVLLACVPESYFLAKFHWPSEQEEFAWRPLWSFANTILTLFVGTAVFPLDYTAIGFALAVTVAGTYYLLFSARKGRIDFILIATLTVGGLVLSLSSLGGLDRRTALFLYPFALLLIVIAITSLPRHARQLAIVVLVLFQLIGVRNFISHMDTIKGSFNTNFATALGSIREAQAKCSGRLIVFDHDPVMTYLLDEANIQVSSPYSGRSYFSEMKKGDCVVQVKSNPGLFTREILEKFNEVEMLDKLNVVGREQIGRDRFYRLKRSESGVPFDEYYLDITFYEVMNEWSGASMQASRIRYFVER